MKKYDMKEFTFLIPIRLDSIVRLENLMATIDVVTKYFVTNIKVLNVDAYDNGILPRLIGRKAGYEFIEDWDNVFYRTKYLNRMAIDTNTTYLVIWDADVIVPIEQLKQAADLMRNGFDIVYPYDGLFYDTTDMIRESFLKKYDIRFLKRNTAKMGLIYGCKMRGGAIFVNKQKYMDSGMENEEFYGWGPEDFERFARWKILGYKISFVHGCLFHLSHSRGDDSMFRSHEQLKDTNNAFLKTKYSSKEEILKERKFYNENITNLADLS